jgi:hypothetical protein
LSLVCATADKLINKASIATIFFMADLF